MLHKRDINTKKISYIKELYAFEDDLLLKVQKSIADNNLRPINLGAEEAKIIQILLKLHNSKTVVEVGTLAGYSAIWIARALPDGGKVYTFEKDENCAAIARNNILKTDIEKKIEIIVGDAHERLLEFRTKGPFDAMFIDAEKGGYCKYLDWAEKYIRSGGLIIADNTFMFGQVYDDDTPEKRYENEVPVMKEFNIRLADKNKYNSVILPTIEGLSIAIKKF